MKKLEVKITGAQIKSFTVELDESGGTDISATIVLLTAQGEPITTHTIATNSWNDKDKFALPYGAIPAIHKIADELERVVTEKYSERFLSLPTKAE